MTTTPAAAFATGDDLDLPWPCRRRIVFLTRDLARIEGRNLLGLGRAYSFYVGQRDATDGNSCWWYESGALFAGWKKLNNHPNRPYKGRADFVEDIKKRIAKAERGEK